MSLPHRSRNPQTGKQCRLSVPEEPSKVPPGLGPEPGLSSSLEVSAWLHSWDHIYLQKGSLGSPPPTLPFHLRLTFSGRGCDTALECLPALRLSPLLAFGSPAGETLSLTASLEAGTQRV